MLKMTPFSRLNAAALNSTVAISVMSSLHTLYPTIVFGHTSALTTDGATQMRAVVRD
jgi:hypothetical protein